MSWIDFLDTHCEKIPNHIALIDQGTRRTLNYRNLLLEVNKWTEYLLSKNIKKGDRVAYLETNSIEHLTLFFACVKLGAIFVLLNYRLSWGELDIILDIIEPSLTITNGDNPFKEDFKHENRQNLKLPQQKSLLKLDTVNDLDPCLMLFTSGTTGKPKGVLLHGKMLQSNQIETCRGWGLKSTDKTIVETPFFHTGGYNVLCLPLLGIGGQVIIAAEFNLKTLFETIQKDKITVYFGVPTMFQMMLEHSAVHNVDFSSIRFFVSGGAHCPKKVIESFQKKGIVFKQGFGLTEVGPNCFLLEEKDAIRKLGSIGKPMPHSHVFLLNKNDEKANVNEIGEILISGPHLCAGYYKDQQLFLSSCFGTAFRTGDLARFDSEGFYTIVGRKKDMYIIGGENIYPAEVEKVILDIESVSQAVVVSRPDNKWGEVGVAFLLSTTHFSIGELRHLLANKLSRYKHPHQIKYLEEFPLLANGKIDRKKLSEWASHSWRENESCHI